MIFSSKAYLCLILKKKKTLKIFSKKQESPMLDYLQSCLPAKWEHLYILYMFQLQLVSLTGYIVSHQVCFFVYWLFIFFFFCQVPATIYFLSNFLLMIMRNFFVFPQRKLYHLLGYIVSHPLCFVVNWLLIFSLPSPWKILIFKYVLC